jgi:hypothetical protein
LCWDCEKQSTGTSLSRYGLILAEEVLASCQMDLARGRRTGCPPIGLGHVVRIRSNVFALAQFGALSEKMSSGHFVDAERPLLRKAHSNGTQDEAGHATDRPRVRGTVRASQDRAELASGPASGIEKISDGHFIVADRAEMRTVASYSTQYMPV